MTYLFVVLFSLLVKILGLYVYKSDKDKGHTWQKVLFMYI